MSRLSRGDWLVAVTLVVFALLAVALHNSIAGLGDMARDIGQTGTAIQTSGRETADELRSAVAPTADALELIPLAGPRVADAIRDTADRSARAVERETRINGSDLVQAGRQGERDAQATARLVGLLAFLVPAVLLLFQWVPRRLEDWRAEPVRQQAPAPRPRAARR